MISALNVELGIRRSTGSDELAAIRSRQSQATFVLRDRLSALEREIRDQAAVVSGIRSQLDGTVAADDSAVRRDQEARYESASTDLDSLRARYSEAISAAAATPDLYYSEQSAAIDASRSDQNALASMIADAQADLESVERIQRLKRDLTGEE